MPNQTHKLHQVIFHNILPPILQCFLYSMRGRLQQTVFRRKEMAEWASNRNVCNSCSSPMKCSCLNCSIFSCMKFSLFATAKETPGWKLCNSVVHCAVCFEEKIKGQHERCEDHSDDYVVSGNKFDPVRFLESGSTSNTNIYSSSSCRSESPVCSNNEKVFIRIHKTRDRDVG